MIEHINRRNKKFYLYQGTTKLGNPKYFFSSKPDGNPVDVIPDSYEIYENPNAQVFLRKIPPQIITPEEIEIVKSGVKKYAKIDYFMIDVKVKNIIIYMPDQNLEQLLEIVSSYHGNNSLRAKNAVAFSLSYSPMMQFVLEDVQTREFTIERWCFRGSVDDWIPLSQSSNLKELVKNYVCHLGKDSFYDLM